MLSHENYHIWEQEIEHFCPTMRLTLLFPKTLYHQEIREYNKWVRSNRMACATISFALSNDVLGHARDCLSGRKIIQVTRIVFQRQTFLNKFRTHRQFHETKMKENEKFRTFINRVQHFASILKFMSINIDSQKTQWRF